jgi:predicted nucleic acid-binding protein
VSIFVVDVSIVVKWFVVRGSQRGGATPARRALHASDFIDGAVAAQR